MLGGRALALLKERLMEKFLVPGATIARLPVFVPVSPLAKWLKFLWSALHSLHLDCLRLFGIL